MLRLLTILVVLSGPTFGQESGKLPSYMIGSFQLTTSEGFTDFMSEMGVGWFQRSIACSLYPTKEISQESDGEVKMKMLTTYKNTYKSFYLDQTKEETTQDGRTVNVITRVDGNRMIRVATPIPGSEGLDITTRVVHEFLNGGQTIKVTTTIDQNPKIKAVRVFERL